MNSMDETREFLKSIGLPEGDAYDLPTSEKRFSDGGQYRFEIPGIHNRKEYEDAAYLLLQQQGAKVKKLGKVA